MVFTRRQSRVTGEAQSANISAAQFPATPTKIPTRKADISPAKQLLYGAAAMVERSATGQPAAFAVNTTHDADLIAELRLQVTPKQAPHVKPSRKEMHPQLEKQAIATPNEASPWLGFFKMQPQTEPRQFGSKLHNALPESPTPVKVLPPVASSSLVRQIAPSYEFTFRRESSVQLSAEARKIMEETRAEASLIRAKLAAEAAEKSRALQEQNVGSLGRKIAQPKGRFSDAHSAAFNRMDSIANHPSAWRAAAKRTTVTIIEHPDKKLPTGTLKRSRSNADLQASSNDLESPSTVSSSSEATRGAKRIKQDAPATATPSIMRNDKSLSATKPNGTMRSARTALYTPTKSSLARSKQTAHLKKTQIPALVRHHSASPTKTTTPTTSSQTAVKATSTFLSPTKTSLHRAQEHKQSAQSPLARSSPRPLSQSGKSSPATPLSGMLTASAVVATPTPGRIKDMPVVRPLPQPPLDSPRPLSSMAKIKSILRTPLRHYSNDPAKIAAGTHMATPPSVKAPATAPVVKHVVFSASARLKAARDEAKASSEEPEILYPPLPQSVPHNSQVKSFAQQGPTMPGDFTFRAGNEIKFGSPMTSTIRAVRSSDQSPAIQPAACSNKRKVAEFDDVHSAIVDCHDDDKENSPLEEHRPSKRMRQDPAAASKTVKNPMPPIGTLSTTLARKTTAKSAFSSGSSSRAMKKRTGGLTASRLAYLSQPKKR